MPQNHGIKAGSIETGKEFPLTPYAPVIYKRKETWLVIADNVGQIGDEIENTIGIPQRGATSGNMSVKSVLAREVDPHALHWEVDVEWDSRVDENNDQGEDPVLWRPKVRWSTEIMELAMPYERVTGMPVWNAVCEPFTVTAPHAVPVRTLTRYERIDVLDGLDVLQQQYANRINKSEFHGWPPWSVLLASIEGEDAVINKELLAQVTYVTKYMNLWAPNFYVPSRRYDSDVQTPVTAIEFIGWRLSLLNQGTKYLENADDDFDDAKPFLDAHGNPTTGNLNLDGTKLPDDLDGNFFHFFQHELAEFGPLNI